MMIDWTDEAIQAAMDAYFGYPIRKSPELERCMINALKAGFHTQEKTAIASQRPVTDLTMFLAWEQGYNEALIDAENIAKDTHDSYNLDNSYCQGVCDASSGIAKRIKDLKK